MGIVDWFNQLGSNIKKGADWLGGKVSQGIDWVHEKVVRPAGEFFKPVAHGLGFGDAYDKTREALSGLNNVQKKQFQQGGASAQDWGNAIGQVGRAGGAILRKIPGVGGAVGEFARKNF